MPQLASRDLARRIAQALALIGGAAALVASCGAAGRSYTWNHSPSLPRGLYRLCPTAHPVRDAVVSFPVPPTVTALISARHYLPADAKLLKTVVALPGDRVDIDPSGYRVNGHLIGSVSPTDAVGRPLPAFSFSGPVPPGFAFVATSAPLSFDSRYFGPVPISSLAVAVPVWTY